MKKIMGFILFGLIVLYSPSVSASLIDPFQQGLLDPVSFLVVDDPDSTDLDQVILSTSFFGLPAGYQLEYLYPGVSDWTILQAVTSFSTPVQGSAPVSFRLHNTATGGVDTSGSITFQGLESATYFTSMIIDWDETAMLSLSFTTAGNDDNLAPVPVPAAFWLLGSGLLGIIGMRRKK